MLLRWLHANLMHVSEITCLGLEAAQTCSRGKVQEQVQRGQDQDPVSHSIRKGCVLATADHQSFYSSSAGHFGSKRGSGAYALPLMDLPGTRARRAGHEAEPRHC